jgi:hypothetical protein
MRHHYLDGTYLDFDLDDIGPVSVVPLLYNIAKEGRFCNQIPWSVLQHSIAVGRAAEIMYPGNTLLIKHGYLHDLPEAFYRDVPTPIKKMIGKYWYAMEDHITSRLFNSLRVGALGDDDGKLLHMIDKTMAFVECLNYFDPDTVDYFKTKTELHPEVVSVCTATFGSVLQNQIWDGSDLADWVIDLYKEVIYGDLI